MLSTFTAQHCLTLSPQYQKQFVIASQHKLVIPDSESCAHKNAAYPSHTNLFVC